MTLHIKITTPQLCDCVEFLYIAIQDLNFSSSKFTSQFIILCSLQTHMPVHNVWMCVMLQWCGLFAASCVALYCLKEMTGTVIWGCQQWKLFNIHQYTLNFWVIKQPSQKSCSISLKQAGNDLYYEKRLLCCQSEHAATCQHRSKMRLSEVRRSLLVILSPQT